MTTLTLHGADGSTWELLDRDSPVFLLEGLGGLHLYPVTHRWATTARQSGRRWKGSVADYRGFTMNIRVGDSEAPFRTGDAWRALDANFWAALSHDNTASLVVNDERTLYFRLDDDNDHTYAKDPALVGKAVYSVACVADRPEWVGVTHTATFSLAPGTGGSNYYTATGGPPFIISAPAIGLTATINNPGDLPSYPIWRIIGPATTMSVGVGSKLINIPFSIQSGQQILIDAENQTITDGAGTSLWPLMGSTPVEFALVPPGGDVPIRIGLENGGPTSQIQVTVTPRYRRAW